MNGALNTYYIGNDSKTPDVATGIPLPPSHIAIDWATSQGLPLPPSLARRCEDFHNPETDRDLISSIRNAVNHVEPPVQSDVATDVAFMRRRTEDQVNANRLIASEWRRHADSIEAEAPAVPPTGCRFHRTSSNPSAGRIEVGSVLCKTFACVHCGPVQHARMLRAGIDAFADRPSLVVTPLADDAERRKYEDRHRKRRTRQNNPVASHDFAFVVPVAGDGFTAFSGHADNQGTAMTFYEAMSLLDNALATRIEIARLSTSKDNRRCSWPGLVRDSSTEEPLCGTNADKPNENPMVAMGGTSENMTPERVSSVLTAEGIEHTVSAIRKGKYSISVSPSDYVLMEIALVKSFNICSDEKLVEARKSAQGRRTWEDANDPFAMV